MLTTSRTGLFAGCIAVLMGLAGAATGDAAVEARRGGGGGEEVVLVSTRGDNSVTVLAGADLAHRRTMDIGLGAHELAVSPDGALAAGSAYGGPGPGHQPADHRVAILETATGKVLRTIDLGERMRPNDLVFLPDSRHLLVTSEMTGELLKLDAREGTVVQAIRLPHKAGHMLAAPDAVDRAYISHVMDGAVSVVDVAKGEVLIALPAAHGAEGIACSPDGKLVWCANARSDSVTVIDAEKLEVVETFACAGFPFRVRFTSDGERVLIACPKGAELAVYHAADRTLVCRIPMTGGGGEKTPPTSIAASADPGICYAVCPQVGEVVRIDLKAQKVTARFRTGPIADALAVGLAG